MKKRGASGQREVADRRKANRNTKPPTHPRVILLAGPNGAGKSTAAPRLLRGALGVTEFVNADVIARGLSAFAPENVGLSAGRLMLTRLKTLARRRVDFAFETTMASRMFAPWIAGLLKKGYLFHLVFLWLPSEDFAVERVADRVRLGGHAVPEETIRRRFNTGLSNFFAIYVPLATTWRVYDGTLALRPRLIASGVGPKVGEVRDATTWTLIRQGANLEDQDP